MRFKAYLTEAGPQSTPISKEEAYKWIKEKAPHYINALMDDPTFMPIFRGMPLKQDYILGDSSKFIRKAANTSNETNAFVSSSTRWKDFPRRNQAWICTSWEQTAWGYGGAFLVIPADGSHMGICPTYDFWYSFNEGLKGTGVTDVQDLNHFFDWVRKLSDYQLDSDNMVKFREELKEITADKLTEMVGNHDGYEADTIRRVVKYMKKNPIRNLEEFFEKTLDPNRNGFKWTTTDDYGGVNDSREIWITGECIFIRIETGRMGSQFHKLIAQLGEELYAV